MTWPTTHTCHFGTSKFADPAQIGSWRPPTADFEDVKYPRYYPWRRCDYCGSIHPEDLLTISKEFAGKLRPELADQKYGWPHKVYVTIDHRFEPEREFNVGQLSDGTPITRKGTTFMLKFYNEHLGDEGISDEQFREITKLVWDWTRYHFTRKDGKLLYHFCLEGPK